MSDTLNINIGSKGDVLNIPIITEDSDILNISLTQSNDILNVEIQTIISEWGSIIGDIESQIDLIDLIPISLSELSDDSTHRLVADSEKLTWNNKEDINNKENLVLDNSSIKYPTNNLVKSILDLKVNPSDLSQVAFSGNTSNLNNDANYVIDSTYVHTDNNLTNELKSLYDTAVSNMSSIPTELNDLSDIDIDSPSLGQVIKYNGEKWSNGDIAAVSAGAGVNLYPTQNPSDIYETTGYLYAEKSPMDTIYVDLPVVCNNNKVELISYITNPSINVINLDAGIWTAYFWSYASIDGDSQLVIDYYKRTSSGVETLLFSTQTSNLQTELQQYVLTTLQPSYTLNIGDRLVIKVSGQTTNTSNTIIHGVGGDAAHADYINTPLTTYHNDLAGIQGGESGQYYHLTSAELSSLGEFATQKLNYDTAYTNTHAHLNKTALDLVSGTNTGDQIVPTALSDLTDNSTHRLVTDTEKNTWNGKQDALGFTPYTQTEVNNAFEYKLPSTPTNPETKFLNANKEWSNISIGNGGYSANLYFTPDDSVVTGYKKISYNLPETETELTATIPTGEYLLRTYLFDENINVTTIDSGLWVANFTAKVSVDDQDIKLKCELFLRHSDDSETVLFSAYSPVLVNGTYDVIRTESNQPSFNCILTDRLGIRIYGYTTSVSSVTINTVIGDGRASYFSSPLRLKHNQLRDLNSDNNYLHVTDTEKTTWNSISAHISDTKNPHTVTASQVGTYSTSDIDTLLRNKSNLAIAMAVAL